MVIAIVLLAVLFLVGLANTLFHIAPRKLVIQVQSLFHIVFPSSSSSSSEDSTMTTRSRNSVEESKKNIKDQQRSTTVAIELERVFATFDKNGDGFITRQELGESLRNIGIFSSDKDIESMIEKLDINGDGLIDIQEFEEMYASMGGLVVKEEDEEMELRDAFGVFDGNNDGLITVEELGYVLNSLGIKKGIKVEDCREMIKNVDMDGDGMVNFDEFKHMMKNGGKLISVA